MPLAKLSIDLDAIAENWRAIRDMVSPSKAGAVVKANAYGLGIRPVARRLWRAGCTTYFVASAEEGLELRALLPEAEIVALSAYLPADIREMGEHKVIPVLNHLDDLDLWAAQDRKTGAWLHIDTGMNRLGLSSGEWQDLLADAPDWTRWGICGLISHFACADEPDHPLNLAQQQAANRASEASGLPLSLGNSAGCFLGQRYRGDLVRPGMALYGLNPTPHRSNPMRPVVGLEARILQIRQVSQVGTVGYGASAGVDPGQVLATVGLGYADGFHRALSNIGKLYFQGEPLPLVGRVSMDSVVVDITRVQEKILPGDWLEVIGPHQPADDIADAAGTIGYEILTSLGRRYARHYIGDEP